MHMHAMHMNIHILDMPYTEMMHTVWMQVDNFELAEETPFKSKPPARSRTPVISSPESEPQLCPPRLPASAERRTAEWVTALSPVIEHDEGLPNHGLYMSPKVKVESPAPEETGLRLWNSNFSITCT